LTRERMGVARVTTGDSAALVPAIPPVRLGLFVAPRAASV